LKLKVNKDLKYAHTGIYYTLKYFKTKYEGKESHKILEISQYYAIMNATKQYIRPTYRLLPYCEYKTS